MEEEKQKICKMIDDKATIFELPNDQGFIVYTDEFYQGKLALFHILSHTKDSVLNQLICSDENTFENTLRKFLITAEIEALRIQLKELEYKQS